MSSISIWPKHRTLSVAIIAGQSEPGSGGNEGVVCIPQIFNITEASPLDCLVSYPGQSMWGFYLSAVMQFVYSAAPAY